MLHVLGPVVDDGDGVQNVQCAAVLLQGATSHRQHALTKYCMRFL